MKKKIIAVLLGVLILSQSVMPVGATTISSVKKQQQQTQSSLDATNSEISSIKDEKTQASKKLDELQSKLVDILTSIDVCKDEIEAKKIEIDDARDELLVVEKQAEDQYETMKQRVKFFYEQGDQAYLQILLEAADYADMVNKADYVEKLYEYDRNLLSEYVKSKEKVEEMKKKLEDEEADLEAANYELEQEEKALNELVEEQKKTVDDFSTQLSLAQEKAAEYKKTLENQTAQLKVLEKQEAERQKQLEEQRKLQQQAKNDSSQTTTSEGVSEAGANQSNGQTATTATSATTAGTNQTADGTQIADTTGGLYDNESTSVSDLTAGAGAVGGGSGIGQQAVNYASQFVGNPYVYGGTSLTNGTDCSGFTQSVYSHFGISIPRDSTSQRSVGTEVSLADAKPGDIVCYAGHVALYAGNGQIVHASTERTGITWGNVTYRTILSIRRVSN